MRRVDAELFVVELHGRKGAPFVVALDRLRAPCCVSTYVRQLVPVVAARTNEKNPSSSIWGSTSSKVNRASQFRQVHMVVSIAVFDASPVVEVRGGDAVIQNPCSLSNLLA